MGKFNRDRGGRSRDRRGGGFGRRDSGRGFNRGGDRPAMHKVVCDACHKDCEVPFKPSNDKPIYCNECFAKVGGGRSRDRRDGDRPHFGNKNTSLTNQDSQEILQGIKNLNYKLDEILTAIKTEKAPAKNTATKTTTKKTSKKKVAVKKVTKKKTASKKKK